MRPDWRTQFMDLAYAVSQRGSCLRKKVGVVLVRDRDKHVVSSGYNGAPRGVPDCTEVGCDLREVNGKPSCFRTLHAESNALDRAGLMSEPHTMYCTVIPCRNCALRIIQNGWIHTVVYSEYYESQLTNEVVDLFAGRDPDTLRYLMERFGEAAAPKTRVELIQFKRQSLDVLASRVYGYALLDEMRKNIVDPKWREYAERLGKALGVEEPTERDRPKLHDLIKTGDADASPSITDRNGEVALAYCRRCKKGEGELGPFCV